MQNGPVIGEVAILVSKTKDKPQIEHAVKDIQQESNMKDDVFVDTVHRFSGLDKSFVSKH
jgi:hypothetical protein